jgi:cytochrome c-type biogenesis protein CcmE
VARKRSPARLVVALSVAAALAVFILYTSIAGNATPTLQPSQLAGHTGEVDLDGRVVGPVSGDSYSTAGTHFWIRDIHGGAKVPIVYHGAIPDLFRVGRSVVVTGRVRHGVFVANKDSLVTRCPSKYTPAKKSG